MPGTTLIVVNYNTADRTARLVEQISGAVDEVIVVDNASSDGSAEPLAALLQRHDNLRFVALTYNRGYGAGANAGARVASGEVLIVANPDIEIEPAALRRLVAEASLPRVGLAAPLFRNSDGTLQRSAHRRDPLLLSTLYELCRPFAALMRLLAPGWHPTLFSAAAHGSDRDCAHVLGALMAVRREAFDAVGAFDEGFFLYREETDLCRRLRQAGWRVRHVADATAVHEGGASSPERTPTMTRPVALTSHYRYIAKHGGRITAAAAWFLGIAGAAVWLILGPKRRLARAVLRWHLQNGPRTGWASCA